MPDIDGSTATIPLIGAVYSVLLGIPRSEADAMVHTSGTDDAYMRLVYDREEVGILLVYAPSPESVENVADRGVELEMAPIGRDGLVFLVNAINPVTSLEPEQIVSIYAGETRNWKDVGGKDVAIKAFQRPLRSGSQTMMDMLVMKGVPMMETETAYVINEMGFLMDAVAAFDNADASIGYNVYYFVTKMEANENVRMLAVGGVQPSTESISDGSYPFFTDFYAVIRKDAPKNSPERILFNWIQSADGQNLVRHEGYATRG
jgi:ABC-type phosphate transport system substrate-binding protein